MNNNIYSNPSYIPSQSTAQPSNLYQYNNVNSPSEYAEGLLKANRGKKVEAHISFTDSIEWRDSIFTGILEDSGKDYILIYDEVSNKRYLVWSVYLDYIIFFEKVNK